MKITKTKEIEKVTEELTVEPGTYYFEDDYYLYKIFFMEDELKGLINSAKTIK